MFTGGWELSSPGLASFTAPNARGMDRNLLKTTTAIIYVWIFAKHPVICPSIILRSEVIGIALGIKKDIVNYTTEGAFR